MRVRFVVAGLTLSLLAGCLDADAKDGNSGESDAPDQLDQRDGCENWENWSCSTSTNYCYARCDDASHSYWMKCYPGLDIDCYAYYPNGRDGCEGYSGDGCSACESALTSCGI